MPNLCVYLPNHGYNDDDPIFVSWLNGVYYVNDKDNNSFLLAESVGGSIVQYDTTITSGYVRYNTSATNVISGLDHLEGESVYVTSGGSIIGRYTVSGGSITAPGALTTFQIGLPYTMKIKTMRFAVPSPDTVQTRIKRATEVALRNVRTQGGKLGVEYDGREYLQDIDPEFSVKADDSKITAQGGFNKDGFVVVKSETPLPMTVLATVVTLDVTEQ